MIKHKLILLIILLTSTNVFADIDVSTKGGYYTLFDESITKDAKNTTLVSFIVRYTDEGTRNNSELYLTIYNCRSHKATVLLEPTKQIVRAGGYTPPDSNGRALGDYACRVAYPVY